MCEGPKTILFLSMSADESSKVFGGDSLFHML